MNKILAKILSVMVLGMSLASSAQNFTVTSPSTDPYKKLCKPIKVMDDLQFQVMVKSNKYITYTASILYGAWVQIDNYSQNVDSKFNLPSHHLNL